MNAVEWNKKEELVADQALKHLKQYTSLLAALTENGRSELALLIKMQEYCYDNMNFLKVFQKIVVLFYKGRLWMTWFLLQVKNECSASAKNRILRYWACTLKRLCCMCTVHNLDGFVGQLVCLLNMIVYIDASVHCETVNSNDLKLSVV